MRIISKQSSDNVSNSLNNGKVNTNQGCSVNDEEFTDFEEESVSTDGLEIDITESPKHEKDIDFEDKRVLENIEEEIERQLDEKAAKSNLSATNVKNILKHVITNEHVLAMVRNTTEGRQAGCDFVYEPKLTRAKAKELLRTQSAAAIPWAKPKSEVHILINEELPEDSDDDEYVPHEDEQSEEDKEDKESCNPSDIESQPATPAATTAPTHDCSTQTNWHWTTADDGLFKVPQPANPGTNDEHTEMIALRTRSKLSLSDTPLEVIEESLIPPDITTDMYDLECDDDDWKDFLKKFTRPLDEAMHGTQEDDDEADPEYNVLADEEIDAIDLEELREDRAVKVTKKELNTLVAELFEFSEMFTNAKELEKNVQHPVPDNNDVNNTTQHLELHAADNIQQQDEPIVVKDIFIEAVVMSSEQFLLYEQQMRQHVQMLTQNYILTYEHPVLSEMAVNFKNMLLSFHELAKYNPNSPFNPYNLQMAVDFINDWEKMIKNNSDEVQEMKKYVGRVVDKYNESRVKGYEYICTFPPLLMKTVTASSAFLYPSLLPKIPFRCFHKSPRTTYIQPENELIALGLEQFIPYMDNFEAYKTKFKALRLADVAHFISRYMMPHKDAKKLYTHIKAMKDKKVQPNPINYYFTNNKAPTTLHYVVPLQEFGIMPPCMRQADTLPYQWKIFIYPETKLPPPQITLSKVPKPPAYNSKLAKKKKLLIPKGKTIPCNEDQVVIINHEGAFESKIEVRSPQVVIIEKVPVTNVRVEKPTRKRRRGPVKKKKLLPKIEEIYLCPDAFAPESIVLKEECFSVTNNKSVNIKTKSSAEIYINTDKPLKDDTAVSNNNNHSVAKVPGDGEVASKHTSNANKSIPTSLLSFKFNSSIFKNLREDNMLPSMPFLMTPMKDPALDHPESTSAEPPNEKDDKQRLSPDIPRIEEVDNVVDNSSDNHNESKRDDEDELNALMKASSTMQQKNRRLQANSSKKAKLMREYNATLAMLCPEDSSMSEEKAKNYAQAFYDKVQERLENDSPLEYQKFMEVLSEHDETSSSVSDLYEKIESVLSPKHSDLCEEFLTFLSPEQAKQIGKLVPHFMLSNMSLFLRKLEIYYSNQPAQLRRIYNSLTELADVADVTMDKVRASILPLLKGNTLLIDWFLQMFPSEPPPDSLKTNWEHISCDDGDDLDSDDKVFETINLPEVEDPYGGPNCICKCHNIADEMYASRARHCIPCGTKFLQGRVYVQTGKGLRLANVTFNNSPNTDHNSRLSVKPIVRQKRKSETSPSKIQIMMSPTKDDEPRHSNESEDDINTETAHSKKMKTLKAFRTNSPSKARRKTTGTTTNKSTPKSQKADSSKGSCKNKTKTDTPSTPSSSSSSSSRKTKLAPNKIVNKCGSHNLQDEIVIPEDRETPAVSSAVVVKNEQVEMEQTKTECEPEVTEWDVKASPGHSVESVDTCEESSQDTIDGPGSESDNDSITEEIDSVISENSEDSEDTAVEQTDATHSWTRDEDKIILQTFQERGDTSDVFNDMQKALPSRTVAEIRQRFQTLMSLLQKMAAS